ncbi:MAG TPA: hypothetical protein VFN37_00025 [Candidatus Baltobacteraceae bacterium]|nr:hypothetical protein [Candidatus Baltobacteraceae bacterium]
MKRTILALILTLGLPAAVYAQQGPPPGGMGPGGGMMHQRMSAADRAKMMQMHAQARATILAALSPAHKQLLASVVSGLAVSTSPNAKAAAAKLDSQLSATEKKAIVDAANRMHQAMQAMMPSPPPGAPMHHMYMSSDPGEMLLMMAAMNIMGSDGMMHAMPQ